MRRYPINLKSFLGRKIETNMKEITGDLKKSHIKLIFRVKEVTGENAYTEFFSKNFQDHILEANKKKELKS